MMKNQKLNQSGIGHLGLFLAVLVIAAIGFAGWRVYTTNKNKGVENNQVSQSGNKEGSAEIIKWEFNGNEWKPSEAPPKCPNPLLSVSPVEVSKATSVLYPGQIRGQYKPHGGFRFDNASDNKVEVKMAMNATVIDGSRYIEKGEVQYMFDFINSCGIRLRYDHLAALSEPLQKIAKTFPEPKVDDSRTTKIENGQIFKAGEVIATAIGYPSPKLNVSVDFGVFDLRQSNEASKDSAYSSKHSQNKELDFYAICWLPELPAKDAAIVAGLPPGDPKSGKTSDYCK